MNARVTATRLSDGRALRYFDRPGSPPRSAADLTDRRAPTPPAPPAPRSEVRVDPLTGDRVTVAAHRQGRAHLPSDGECPLCPSTPQRPTEVPAAEYQVVVFDNAAPAYGPGRGRGRAEVVVYSPDHRATFADLGVEGAVTVVAAWAQRAAALSALEGVGYVYAFENRGEEIGVTLTHPHGQIYAYPFVPPHAERAERAAARHLEAHGTCLGCDTLADELADGRRVVGEGDDWVAYVPFAARWPFEVHLVPRRHVSTLDQLSDGEARGFCRLYLDVLARLDGVFGVPMPSIAGWHPPPVAAPRRGRHLRMQVASIRRAPDRLKYLAGSESGQGAWINDIVPEAAASMLRGVEVGTVLP